MDIQGHFTQKGLALSTKLLTGETLRITRVVAGSGSTADPMAATSLPQPKQALAVNSPTRSGNTATIPATLTAALAEKAYSLTELGIYAWDPEEGEILYKLYQLSAPVDISPDSQLVMRFYLEETVSQELEVTVSPAGLITELEFAPVRDIVRAVSVPTRNVTLDIADAQAYLDALPRQLTERVVLFVSGTTDMPLTVSGFYGSGTIDIRAESPEFCTIKNLVTVSNCSVYVNLSRLLLETPGGDAVNTGLLTISDSPHVQVQQCGLSGGSEGPKDGLYLSGGSMVSVEEVQISGFHTAVFAERCSVVTIFNSAASDFHDNTTGGHVWRGGIILLGGNTPQTMGGSTNIKEGGMIVSKSGTLL